jgi:hypothetical protein
MRERYFIAQQSHRIDVRRHFRIYKSIKMFLFGFFVYTWGVGSSLIPIGLMTQRKERK